MESLESRQLLSATNPLMHSDAIRLSPADASTTTQVDGYSPAQIRHAYGFDTVGFSNGVAADGSGQTIAIIDAYNDPKISSDLTTFDEQFGLSAAPSLKVVNQTGGSTLPTTDGGWSGEIALDVEWAHAIAPNANILLVEANSSSLTDLMSAVDYARKAAGVAVVSMSWGGSEFFSWDGSEFTGQTQYDSYFTTPSGHQGVTFVAAAGDSGASSGVQWPASSANVLSVGGTSLYVADQNGTYYTESSWDGTSGGTSQVEPEPSYQSNVQSTGVRTTPDVAYDADPNTGFAVYDSVPYQGATGWQVVGGTSAGAPQWAALVAIADQGRTAAGKGTLDGTSQTLPALYGLYVSYGANPVTYAQYTNDFNDVIDSGGGRGGWRWRWGGLGFSNPATAGYDLSTGLGTPKAANVIQALSGTSISTTTGTPGGGDTPPSGGTQPQQLPASQLDVAFASNPVASVMGGQRAVLRLRITNDGSTRFTGPVSVDLYAGTSSATDATSIGNDTHVSQSVFSNVDLGVGKSKVVTVKYDYPTSLSSGAYFLIASLQEMGLNVASAATSSPSTMQVTAAQVDLAASFAASQPVTVKTGRMTSVVVTIQNLGNVTAAGTLGVNLYESKDGTLNTATDALMNGIAGRSIHIAPDRSIRVRLSFVAPANPAPGTYSLIAAINSSTQVADGNAANDTAVIATRAS
ncbi:MAG TPA: S53 family peptidase [Tepidisphaeraceae bacterium]|jgi:hypothetical protein